MIPGQDSDILRYSAWRRPSEARRSEVLPVDRIIPSLTKGCLLAAEENASTFELYHLVFTRLDVGSVSSDHLESCCENFKFTS
jgi:hypothetical protein